MRRLSFVGILFGVALAGGCGRPAEDEPGKLAGDAASHHADSSPAAEAGDDEGWIVLFDGKSLEGWTPNENADTWSVKDGALVADGERSHLFYTGPVENHHFENFEWKCEIMTRPGANSGMYFHTEMQDEGWPAKGIEVQINNTHDDPRKTGSIYRAKDIMDESPVKDDEWFTMHVIVNGRRVVVKINDKVVNEWEQPEDFKREEGWEGNVMSSGTLALQAHDPGSEVHFRRVLVKPLP